MAGAPSNEKILTPDDAGQVLDKLLPAQNKRYQLGLKLKLPQYAVEAICSAKGVSPEDQLRDILIEFLKQVEPRPTWKVIIEALRSPSVNLPALAKALEDDSTICAVPELTKFDTSDAEFAVPPTVADDDVKPKPCASLSPITSQVSSVEIVQGLVKDFRQRFNALKKMTIDCLEKCKFAVMTVLFTLTSIPAVKEHEDFLLPKHKALSQSESHMEMFSLLNFYWNYLSYHLLDQLIEALNLEEPAFDPITAKMAVYKSDIHEFMKRTTLQVYCQVQPPRVDEDPPPGFRKMVVKFNWPLTATLEDVEKFRQQYARCYDLQTCAMMLSSIGTGSFTATWFLPTSVVKMLVNDNALTVFKEFSVTEVVVHTSTETCVYPTHKKVILLSANDSSASTHYHERAIADMVEEEYQFVEQPSEDMFCPVTKYPLLYPHLTSCCGNHLSWNAGIRIKKEKGKCPLCNSEDFEIFLNKNFQRQVKSLQVYCRYKKRGCKWQGNLGSYTEHIHSCSMKGDILPEAVVSDYAKLMPSEKQNVLMSNCVEKTLSEDDLFEIQEELYDVRVKWRTIGLGLKVSSSDLYVIDRDKVDSEEKFESVLLRWVRNGKDCTWSSLCHVLSTRTVGEAALAQKIKEKHISHSSTQEALSPVQLHPGAVREMCESADSRETSKRSPTPKSQAIPLSVSSPRASPIIANSGAGLTSFVGSETESAATAENEKTVHDLFSPGSIQPTAQHSSASQQESSSINIAMPVSPTATCGPNASEYLSPSSMEISPVKLAVVSMTSHSSPSDGNQLVDSEMAPRELTLREGIKLRSYQEELAHPGLQGDSYILVAPNGTGKTLVAGYIIMHHLNKMLKEGRKAKVVFVIPTRQLTFQQKMKLQEYIPGIRAVDITGASGQPMYPLVQSSGVDVIVCTAGKLRRELKIKALEIIDFSLIVADECHHAGRPSNYSDIMEFLVRLKLIGKPVQLPQVVGMTASPGAGKGKTMATALDHQLFLCATLDAMAGITAVQQNIKELESVCNEPRSYLEVQDERSSTDPFVLHVKSAMETLEHFIGDIPCVEKGSSKYVGWLASEKEAAENREEDERERISVLDQLKVYSLCLLTYRDFRHEDAMSVLEEIQEFKDQSSFERFLYDVQKGLMEKLSSLPKTPSPLLVHMESILLDQFTHCPESKGIFFVQTIKHTRYATNWIRSSPTLSPGLNSRAKEKAS